jgi:hypothetical protein
MNYIKNTNHPVIIGVGQITIETYTVLHAINKEGPVANIIGRLDSGERCMASSGRNYDLAFYMENEDFLGHEVFITPGESGRNIFEKK